MNISKLSLFLLLGAATTTVCEQQNINIFTAHVGDIFDIPVGPVENFSSGSNCRYIVSNPLDIYFFHKPSGAGNILDEIGWYGYSIEGLDQTVFHRVRAIKPGTTEIIYAREPELKDCGCKHLPYAIASSNGNIVYDNDKQVDQAVADCQKSCDMIQKNQTREYKAVTINILPSEGPVGFKGPFGPKPVE